MYLKKKLPWVLLAVNIFALSQATAGINQYNNLVNSNSCPFVTKELSLQEAVFLALRCSPQICSAKLQRVVDKFMLEVARNQFFPQYSFDVSAIYSNDNKPFYDTNPRVDLQTPLGTQIGVGIEDQVNRGRETVGKLEVTQPLLRGFGLAVTQAKYHNALDDECINRLLFKDAFINTITTVIKAYYKLVQDCNNLKVDQIALKNAVKLLNITQLKIKAGRVAPTEIVQQQAQVANQKLAILRDQNNLSMDYRDLLIKLGLDPRSNLVIDERIQVSICPLPPIHEAIQLALANNIEYQKSLFTLRKLERDVLVAKDEQKWKLDVKGSASQTIQRNTTFANTELDNINNIGNDLPHDDRTLVLNLNVPIHDLNRKQRLVKAKVALQQFKVALETQRRQLIAGVMNAHEYLQTLAQQLEFAQSAVTYSEQSLDIAKKKFEYGRTTMFEVTSLQKSLTVQQLSLITQQIAYVDAQADFERILGISLQKWGIELRC